MKLLVDACVSRKYCEELKKAGYMDVIYINDLRGSMSDQEIISIGYQLGAWICTCNIKHFEPYYDKIIPLKSKKKVKYQIKETIKYLGELNAERNL